MTTLADLAIGDAFIVVGQVTAQDPVAGDTVTMYGPAAVVQGTITISPAGAITGQLVNAPSATPVQPAPGLNMVSVGNVLQNDQTSETYVAMRVQVQLDGTWQWSASVNGPVWYPMAGWTVIGSANVS